MGEVVYTSIVRITRHRGPNRTADMPAGEAVRFGVHGAVARHYGTDLEAIGGPVSTTLDYLVAAAGG